MKLSTHGFHRLHGGGKNPHSEILHLIDDLSAPGPKRLHLHQLAIDRSSAQISEVVLVGFEKAKIELMSVLRDNKEPLQG
jgi:hypothetical protein